MDGAPITASRMCSLYQRLGDDDMFSSDLTQVRLWCTAYGLKCETCQSTNIGLEINKAMSKTQNTRMLASRCHLRSSQHRWCFKTGFSAGGVRLLPLPSVPLAPVLVLGFPDAPGLSSAYLRCIA